MLGWVIMAGLLAAASAGASAASDLRARDGGPSQAAMVARGSSVEGLALLRPVLSGVLWRAGFKGGDKERDGLSAAQRGALCEAGFSAARYADFGKNTAYGETTCGTGALDYEPARSSKPAEVLRAVHAVAKDPSKGPVLVHCMWGVHSSGALSAMALVQFCGWSEARAKAYWNDTREGAPCSGGCDAWIDAKFAAFRPDPALALSAAEREAICPD
ncbi:hypothetical protein [Rubrimonas cliftonensis]|uniref:Tyrosine specific protein phosphatases domain-containing protein n=1 Tax=Rubrimonas cliftonensis TaxID=89524 RepID=A0A1H4FPH0_9RHOB|nr:hypothetical protein [Rubrimonas cliftonensis]SEA99194.1 hypothetical protein SAMN05444370_12620 [Rubrimonas cliftonensis]